MKNTTEIKDIDFRVVNEDWSYFKLKDGTILKVRSNIVKIVKVGVEPSTGYPKYDIEFRNAVAAKVPKELMKEPSGKPVAIEPRDIKHEEFDMEFNAPEDIKIKRENWQKYELEDGYDLYVKPHVLKVIRTKKYNKYGEPIYIVNVQLLMNAKKRS